MKSLTKVLMVLLSLLLIFTSIPWHAAVAEANTGTNEGKEEAVASTQESAIQEAQEEVVSMRSETSRTYANPDGTYTTEIAEKPIHYKEDEGSKWLPIDNTLVPIAAEDAVANKANSFTAKFSETTNTTEDLVHVQEGDLAVSLTPVGPEETVPETVQNDIQSVTGEVDSNTILYTDVYPNADIKYTVGIDSVKEDIILKEKPEEETPTSYSFKLDLTGLSYDVLENKQIILSDKATKEPVFFLEAPFMYDSFKPEGYQENDGVTSFAEGALSYDLEMKVEERDEQLFIELVPNREWLTSEERVYPVVIDPTIAKFQPQAKLEDTNIRSHFPNNTGGSETTLGVGLYQDATQTNKIRSLLKFDLSSIPSGTSVLDVNLNMWLASVWNDTDLDVDLHEATNSWTESGATWSKRDGVNSWLKSGGDYSSPILGTQNLSYLTDSIANYKWNIPVTTVHRWIHDPQTNKGLLLKANDETVKTWKKFISSDEALSPSKTPLLAVTYTSGSRLGMERYWSFSDHDLADAQGHVNLGTGNLLINSTDFFLTGRGNSGFTFERTYNSKSVEHSAVGYGWSFSGSETITEYNNGNALLQESDGTTHLFTYDIATKKYTAPTGMYMSLTKTAAGLYTGTFTLADNEGNRTIFQTGDYDDQTRSKVYRIAYEEDRNSNRITYNRQTDGTLSGITDATGRTLSLQYQNGKIISTSFDGVKKTAYSYYSDGTLKTSTNFEDSTNTTGSITTYQYNSTRQLSAVVDARGEITKYLYKDSYLNSVEQPAIADSSSLITYDYSNIKNFVVAETDARGSRKTYTLNSNYLILSVTDAMGYTTSNNYDGKYNLLNSTDSKGNITTNTYDEKGNTLSTTDSLGNKTTYTYNYFNQPLTIKDANGTHTNLYNSYGDLMKETNTLGESTAYTYYEPYGNLKTLTLPDGTVEQYDYDALQNYPVKTTDSLKRSASVVNDKYGNTTQFTDAKGNTFAYQYNGENRLGSITDPKGTLTSYGYDLNGNLTNIRNGRGHTVLLGYNAQNQITSRLEPLGQKMEFRYDANGNLIEEVRPDGLTKVTTTYNQNNLPEFIRINGNLKWQYEYDGNGNIVSVKNGETGAVSSFQHDANDRLKTLITGSQKVDYDYSMTDAVLSIKGSSGTASFIQTFEYDVKNQVKNMYRNGTNQASFDYKPTGALAERRYVNGVHTSFNYDAAQQLDYLKVVKGTTVLLEERNGYDLNGNLSTVASAAGQKTFGYDVLNQLESQSLPANGLSESYTYDAVGNRLSKATVKNGSTSNTSYSYNANNQLINVNGQTYTYDANGNRTKDSKYTYLYNQFNQLTSIKNLSGTTTAAYTYDEKGRRISKTVGGKTTYFHYGEGIQVLFETDSAGQIIVEYQYDSSGFPLTMTKNDATYYYIYNSNGEISSLTDSLGTVLASYTYDAWGNVLEEAGPMASENPYRYKRYYYDEETKLYYMTSRYYQPTEAVFLSTDPIGGDSANPEGLNGYNYVSNNPLNYVDHNGEERKGDYGGSSGGAGGGGSSVVKKVPAKTIKKAKTPVKASDIKFSDKFKLPGYKNQVAKRGWTKESIAKVINKPYKIATSVNKYTKNGVIVYYKDKVHYVAVDNGTKKVIQISDLTKDKWPFDPTFNK